MKWTISYTNYESIRKSTERFVSVFGTEKKNTLSLQDRIFDVTVKKSLSKEPSKEYDIIAHSVDSPMKNLAVILKNLFAADFCKGVPGVSPASSSVFMCIIFVLIHWIMFYLL